MLTLAQVEKLQCHITAFPLTTKIGKTQQKKNEKGGKKEGQDKNTATTALK